MPTLIETARALWANIRNETADGANTSGRVADAADAILDAVEAIGEGSDGLTPFIGENGNWWIGTTDTGVKARGNDGDPGTTPHIGANGNWWIGTTDTGVKAQGDDGDPGTTPHIGANGNWYIGTTDTGVRAQGNDGDPGITPHIGANGNWYIGTTDTGVKAQGTKGDPGAAAPVTISLFKWSNNGITQPIIWKWPAARTVANVLLMTNCTAIYVTISGVTYNQTTLPGITIPANTEMVINDITIQTGYTNANALILLS